MSIRKTPPDFKYYSPGSIFRNIETNERFMLMCDWLNTPLHERTIQLVSLDTGEARLGFLVGCPIRVTVKDLYKIGVKSHWIVEKVVQRNITVEVAYKQQV